MIKKLKLSAIVVLCVAIVITMGLVGCKTATTETTAAATTASAETTVAETTAAATTAAETTAPIKEGDWLTLPDVSGLKVDGSIGYSAPTFDNYYWSDSLKFIEEVMGNAGAKVLSFDPKWDPLQQQKGIEGFISAGVKGVIMCPADQTSAPSVVDLLNKANIPVIWINEVMSVDPTTMVTGIGTSPYYDGQLVADALIKYTGTKGNVIIIDLPAYFGTRERIRGAVDRLKEKAPDIKIIAQEKWGGTQSPSPITAQQQTDVLIQKYGDQIDAIIAIADPCAMGIVASVEAAGLQDKIKVYSYDGSAEAIQAMKDKRPLYCTTMLYPEQAGKWSASMMIEYLNNGPSAIPAEVLMFNSGIMLQEDAIAGKTAAETIPDLSKFVKAMSLLNYPNLDPEWVKKEESK